MHLFSYITTVLIGLSLPTNRGHTAEAIPSDIRAALARPRSAEQPTLGADKAYRVLLSDYMKSHWNAVLESFAALSPDEQNTAVVAAAAGLDEKEYFEFSKSFLRLIARSNVDTYTLSDFLALDGYKGGFLEVNFDSPELSSALKEALSGVGVDKETGVDFRVRLQDIISGKSKKEYEQYAYNNGLKNVRKRLAVVGTSQAQSVGSEIEIISAKQAEGTMPRIAEQSSSGGSKLRLTFWLLCVPVVITGLWLWMRKPK